MPCVWLYVGCKALENDTIALAFDSVDKNKIRCIVGRQVYQFQWSYVTHDHCTSHAILYSFLRFWSASTVLVAAHYIIMSLYWNFAWPTATGHNNVILNSLLLQCNKVEIAVKEGEEVCRNKRRPHVNSSSCNQSVRSGDNKIRFNWKLISSAQHKTNHWWWMMYDFHLRSGIGTCSTCPRLYYPPLTRLPCTGTDVDFWFRKNAATTTAIAHHQFNWSIINSNQLPYLCKCSYNMP